MTEDGNKVLLAQSALGADAEEFMKSELGQTMIGLARIEVKIAVDKLKWISPDDSKGVRDLQNQVWLAERFEGWLVELIMRGRQALQQYDVRTSDIGEDDGQTQSKPDTLHDDA